jgi:hypothetical protein
VIPGALGGRVANCFTMAARRLLSRPQKCYTCCMSFARSLLVVLCAAQAGGTALAAYVLPPRSDVAPVVEPVARKGTRAYKPDGAAPALPADAAQTNSPSGDDALAQCIATWDAGTHISPSKWREICKRQLKDRDAMYR